MSIDVDLRAWIGTLISIPAAAWAAYQLIHGRDFRAKKSSSENTSGIHVASSGSSGPTVIHVDASSHQRGSSAWLALLLVCALGGPLFLWIYPSLRADLPERPPIPPVPDPPAVDAKGKEKPERTPTGAAGADAFHAREIAPGESADDEIGFDAQHEDWYRFTPRQNGSFRYEIKNTMTRPNMTAYTGVAELLDQTKRRVTYAKPAGPGLTARSDLVSVRQGQTYYIRVSAFKEHAATYTIETAFTPIEDARSNAGPDALHARDLTAGESADDEIGFDAQREDWYRFTPSQNGSFRYEIKNTMTGPNVTAYTGVAELLDQTKKRVTYAKPAGSGLTARSDLVSVRQGQTYYIRVSAYKEYAATYRLETGFAPLVDR